LPGNARDFFRKGLMAEKSSLARQGFTAIDKPRIMIIRNTIFIGDKIKNLGTKLHFLFNCRWKAVYNYTKFW
jgi:hypothetical protein